MIHGICEMPCAKPAGSESAQNVQGVSHCIPTQHVLSPAGWLLIVHKLGSWQTQCFPHFRMEKLKLPAESGGAAYRIRTYDPRITNAMLYQLS